MNARSTENIEILVSMEISQFQYIQNTSDRKFMNEPVLATQFYIEQMTQFQDLALSLSNLRHMKHASFSHPFLLHSQADAHKSTCYCSHYNIVSSLLKYCKQWSRDLFDVWHTSGCNNYTLFITVNIMTKTFLVNLNIGLQAY